MRSLLFSSHFYTMIYNPVRYGSLTPVNFLEGVLRADILSDYCYFIIRYGSLTPVNFLEGVHRTNIMCDCCYLYYHIWQPTAC